MSALDGHSLRHLHSLLDLPDLGGTPYRIIEKIGAGGMGVVYLAEDTHLERRVALKVMSSIHAPEEIAGRMMLEARVIARLEHPGIVPIHDVGRLPDGRIYYVMKYVEGKRLDEVVRGGAALPELLRLFQKICDALAFAHDRGVLHRDLKPENIMVGAFGEVLVMDWGVAKVLEGSRMARASSQSEERRPEASASPQAHPGETAVGTVIGTPAYMAPEQRAGDPAHHSIRSDIYALGAILYFILTGGEPPQRSGDGAIVHPGARNRQIRRLLNAICLKALDELPGNRYAGALDLSNDITRFLSGLDVTAYKENLLERSARWMGQNRFLVWIILAYLLMRALVLFFAGR